MTEQQASDQVEQALNKLFWHETREAWVGALLALLDERYIRAKKQDQKEEEAVQQARRTYPHWDRYTDEYCWPDGVRSTDKAGKRLVGGRGQAETRSPHACTPLPTSTVH